MSRQAGLAAAILVGLAALAAQSCELPTGEHGKTPLTLSFIGPDSIIIGDTTVLQVEARDPDGRRLLDPPLDWKQPYYWGRDLGKMTILSVHGDRATVLAQLPGSVRVEVQVPRAEHRFTSGILAEEIPIRYVSGGP